MLGNKKTWMLCFSAIAIAGTVGCGEPVGETTDSSSSQALTSTDRYLVGAASSAAKGIVAQHGRIALELPHGAVAAYLSPQAVTALQNNPQIGLIEKDHKRYLSGSGVPAGEPYGLVKVQADLMPQAAAPSTVCIIDSGLAVYNEDGTPNPHPELDYLGGTLSLSYDDDPGTGQALFDNNGHGTHVAGTIAGETTGVAYGSVNLHIVKVFTADGWAYSSTLQDAAFKCQAAGASVINMSLGGTFKDRWEERAFDQLYAEGVLSIAAAGNDGNSRRSYPASYSSVMSVAATDAADQHASFSQYNSDVEIAAPGVSVWSSTPWLSDAGVTANGVDYAANHLEGAATTDATGVSGVLVDGGICDTAVPNAAGNIVLCRRGSVSFSDKVNNSAGAAGVIVANNEPGGYFGTCADACTEPAPAVTVSQADGDTLLGQLGATVSIVAFSDAEGRGYEAWDGTSMATPHVVGVAGLLRAHFPELGPDAIRAAMNNTAVHPNGLDRDDYYGNGIVKAADAFVSLGGTLGPQCATATDCAADEYCNAGSCAPLCGNGTCDAGEDFASCAADCDECAIDTDCASGYCVSGSCGECIDNTACASGDYCSDLNTCEPLCGNGTCDDSEDFVTCSADCNECAADADCAGGDICNAAGACEPAPACALEGVSCVDDVDCCSGSCSRGKPSTRVCQP